MAKEFIFIVTFCVCFFLFPQELRFRYVTSDDGLPVNDVNVIRKDEKGFMWFGTQDGLCRWDGINFIAYKAGYKTRYLSNSQVLSLYTDKNFLFVGTFQGLTEINLLNDSIKIYYPNKNDFSSKWNSIKEIIKYRNYLLCATPEGIAMFHLTTKNITKKKWNGLNESGITGILKINEYTLIISTMNGLWEWDFNKDTFKKLKLSYLTKVKEDDEKFTCMLYYGGFLYAGTRTKGILKINIETGEILDQIYFANTNENRRENNITGISVYNNSIMVTTKRGLYFVNPITKNITTYFSDDKKFSLLNDEINSLYVDREENLWFATKKSGVNYYLKSFKKFNTNEKFNSYFTFVYAINELEKDKIIFSANFDLILMDIKSGQFQNLTKNTKKKFDYLVIKENVKNPYEIFLGSFGSGVFVLNKSNPDKLSILDGTEKFSVVSLYQHNNYLFLGTVEDGLIIYDLIEKKIFKCFYKKDGLSNTIYDIKTYKKEIYFGTDGDGLLVADFNELLNGKIKILKQFHPLATDSSTKIASGVINSVLIDRNGTKHCGTDNGIIVIQDKKRPILFNDENGLLNNFIYALLADSSGNIWYSTNKGIGFYNPLIITDNNFRNYTMEDGIKNNEHNIGSFHFSQSGIMYFGGPNGFTYFRPSEFRVFKNTPEVVLISITNNGQTMASDSSFSYKKTINLNWKQNNFTAEFISLDFNNPMKNKYSYKLVGYDDRWSNPQYNRYITYTELPGGTYTLLVKSLNSEGVWSLKPYQLSVVVIPPFWKTKWFFAFIFVLTIAGFYGYTVLKTRNIEKEKRILELKVQERTQELAQKNRDITSSIEYAKRIQTALLPDFSFLKKEFANTFIFYLPKDIVSGDFYWAGKKDGLKIIAAVDCTGHGVPGAFMSLIGNNLLNQIILEKGITMPDEILNRLNIEVQNALKQSGKNSETNDGMDVSILCWNEKNEFLWAGANRPLIFIENGKLTKLNGNKYPIGGSQFDTDRKFTLNKFIPESDSMFYLFSDGYADQFGGEKGKKYMFSRLTELLQEIYDLELHEQLKIIGERFYDWKKGYDQVDDVLIIGVKT